MPATHLISVDLPAPLSPTSAITSPSLTSKSTSVSACTDPNDFEIPRSSSVGLSFTVRVITQERVEAPSGAPPPERPPCLLAVLGVRTHADLTLLQEAVREEELVVRLGDRHRSQLRERHLAGAVGDLGVYADGLGALDQRGGERGGGVRPFLDR